MSEKCSLCVKHKTMFCPNSSKCYSIKEKPYYQSKVEILKENAQYKEQRSKAIEYNNENIKRINEKTFGPFNAIPKESVKLELETVNKILESNKED